MTRAEIRTRILEALNEDASSPVFYSLSQIDAIIDEASEVLAEEAQAVKRTAFIPLREGFTYYYTRAIAPDMMVPYRITLTHLDRRLEAKSVFDLDRHNEVWATVTGDSWWWFPVSWDLFGVYPATATGGGVMRVDYLAWPELLLEDEDEPEFPSADHDAHVFYGVYDGLIKQWDVERGLQMFNLFIDQWGNAKFRSGIDKVQARTFQVARTNGNRQRRLR